LYVSVESVFYVYICAQIQLIDSKRSMNVSIFLRQFSDPSLIVHWLQDASVPDASEGGLSGDRLRTLLHMLPEPHEVDMLTPYIGSDTTKLAAVERFFVQLISLPKYVRNSHGYRKKARGNHFSTGGAGVKVKIKLDRRLLQLL